MKTDSEKSSYMWFAFIIIHTSILVCSLFTWNLQITQEVYSLIFKNYDIFILLSYRPLFYIVSAILIYIALNYLISRDIRTCDKPKGVFIFTTTLLLTSTLTSVIIANYPMIIHVDAYLHGGAYENIIINGRLNYISLQRDDVIISPQTFLFYSTYSILTDIKVIDSEILMTIIYPMLLVLLLNTVTKVNACHVGFRVIPTFVILFPTFITHTTGVALFHRYHYSLLLLLLILHMFERKTYTTLPGVILYVAFFLTLVLTHPFTSMFLIISVTTHFVLTTLSFPKDSIRYKALTLLAISSLTIFSSYIAYVYSINMIEEAFEWLFKPEKLLRYIEVSIPIRHKPPPEWAVYHILFATIIRLLWRSSIVLYGILLVATVIANRHDLKNMLTRFWVSLMVATLVVSIPLITSFLWQERFIQFLGVAILALCNEEIDKIRTSKFLRTSFISLLFLSVFIPLIIHYERSYFEVMWNPKSLIDTLDILVGLNEGKQLYGGTKIGIRYAYFKDIYSLSEMIPVYEPVLLTFRPETFERALEGISVTSILDPEYREFRSILLGHDCSIVITVSSDLMIACIFN